MKQLLLLLFAILTFSLYGQNTIRQQFDWQDTPLTYRVGGESVQQWGFSGAKFDDAAPSHPHWVYRMPVSGPGELRVEIRDLVWEAHGKTVASEDQQLSETLTFTTQVVREPEGYFAKISCVPVTPTADGYRRVKAFTLSTQLIPRAELRGGPSTSVLSDGEVYQIAVSESGIFRLSYAFLKDDLGISNLDDIDPRNLRLYGNEGGLVPYDINQERPLDLNENAIYIEGEADGSFDGSDYLLFYAEGPNQWRYDTASDRYELEENVYSDRNYYFLKVAGERGQRLSAQDNLTTTAYTTASYDGLLRYGEDKLNALHEIETIATGTGQHWYTDFFKFARDRDYSEFFDLSGMVVGEPVVVRAAMALRAKVSSRFFIDLNGETLTSEQAARVRINEDGEIFDELAVDTELNGEVTPSSATLSVVLRYPNPGGGEQSEAWLDYLQLRPRLSLNYPGQGQVRFQDSRSYNQASTTFRMTGVSEEVQIWDITNPNQPRRQNVTRSGQQANFGVPTQDALRTFMAFRADDGLTTAEAVGKIEAQNLHNLASQDMLIIYHPDLAEAALRLAEHRRTFDGLQVAAFPTTQVYNEYASGREEPTAIRDFAFDIFMRDGGLRYLLLVGDGSFDNRDLYGFGSALIPVYQNDRNHELFGYPADDYYGIFFSDSNRNPLSADLSIGIGRIPAKNLTEANAVVEKIVQYDTNPTYMLDWRTRMTFLGDDEDGATHSDDAELAVNTVNGISETYNPSKLFFDLFPQESTAAGDRFPAVEAELERAIFRGSVVTTYLGHGGPRGWAQERVLDIPAIQNWRNADRLSLFLTATCTFGDFDNSAFVSAGEELILNGRGGAIGLLTTTRPVFANRNSALTNNSLRELLRQEADGSRQRLGDIIRNAKNRLSSPNAFDNERKFMLMGDPAQQVALPRFQVMTNTINGMTMDSLRRDTLSALEEVTITGQVVDLAGNLMSDFNGIVYPTVYDKAVPASTLRNDPSGSPERTYMVRKNVLFRGRADVQNGTFSFSFIMPKDINFAFGEGKISYYAADTDQRIDAGGSESRFIIGGSNPDGLDNDTPPLVEVFMNSEDFVAGSRVDANPLLVVKLSDDLGINVAGNSIGHDLEGFLNEDTQNSYLLNDFYEAATGDYTRGEVRFPLRDLEPGTYTMKVRAWDVANNVGEGQTEFIVAGDGKIALERVLNYPNPFTDRTCFQFDSSLAGEDLEVLIQVYTVSGRQVKTIEALLPANDGALRLDDCIEWDGRDDYGDILGRGVYLYKVRVRTASGEDRSGESEFEKLVILK